MLPSLVRIFAALLGLAPPESSRVSFGQLPELKTPDVIAPAVMPYLACLYAQRGLPFLKVTIDDEVNYDKNDPQCVATRKRSEVDALKLLQHAPLPAGTSALAFVDNTLSEMDAYVATFAASGGASIAMEDEVHPAFAKYRECLNTQVSYSTVSANTVVSVFQRVIDICRSVRDAAVVEANNALEKKGWDAATRTKAAEATFAAADNQWLSTARQYRDALLSRMRK